MAMRSLIPALVVAANLILSTGCVWFSDLTSEADDAPVAVDTTPPPAPYTAQASYDFPGSKAASDAGNTALAQGLPSSAVEYYEAAIGAWPANPDGWNGLSAAYREVGSEADEDYALFFARRIAWAESSPAASVASSFRNVATGTINRPVEDPRIQAMAEQLALYYAGLDVAQRMAAAGNRAEPQDALDAVGIVPAVIGTAALSIFLGAQLIGIALTD